LPPSEVEHRLASLWSFAADASVLEELFGSMLHGDGRPAASSSSGSGRRHNRQSQQQLATAATAAAAVAAEAFALTPGGPRGSGRETWRLFFVSVVHVPPPRFRPAAVIGGVTAENPQNAQLAKVMATAAKIRDMQRASTHDEGSGGGGAVAAVSGAPLAVGYGKDRLSLLIAAWIDLQVGAPLTPFRLSASPPASLLPHSH
jgi:hypothetical protein